jgi:DNA-binding NarL/FixJ family response regulator
MESLTPSKPKILLADDHRLMLDSFAALFGSQYEVHVVDNLALFEQSVEWLSPDLAILDIQMPDGNSFDVAHQLLRNHPSLRLMFLTMHSEPKYMKRAAEIGACAYIGKRAPAQEVLFAVQTVLNGGKYLKMPDNVASTQSSGQAGLTQRQTEVLRLISQGCSAKDIANALNISVRTAEFHRAAIMDRLNMHSTAMMTRYAVEQGIA